MGEAVRLFDERVPAAMHEAVRIAEALLFAAREPLAEAAIASRLPAGGLALRAAAGSAYLHGMSIAMLICAAVTVLAALASLRYLPGRATPGPSRQPAPAASPPAGTRR